jgi:hypothetical protein
MDTRNSKGARSPLCVGCSQDERGLPRAQLDSLGAPFRRLTGQPAERSGRQAGGSREGWLS